MLVSEVQPSNAEPPIEVTLLGITTFTKPLQEEYLQPVITQYFVRNKSEICHRPLRVHSKG